MITKTNANQGTANMIARISITAAMLLAAVGSAEAGPGTRTLNTPEPAALPLAGAAFAGLMLARPRRRDASSTMPFSTAVELVRI